MAKEVYPTRQDPELVAKAKAMGLSLTDIFREALEKAVKQKRCPTCNKKLS